VTNVIHAKNIRIFRWRVRKRLFNRHDTALGVREGVHIVLSFDVRGFWDVTLHSVDQIYRRFGGP
jgi:hypothetical protein